MNENNDPRLKFLKILKNRSLNEMKELWFLLRLDDAYLPNNSSVVEVGMAMIREMENKNDLETLERMMRDIGISDNEIDIELRSSNLKNNITNKSFDLSLPSSTDVNDMSKFIKAHEPEGLRGICLCNFVRLLKAQDIDLISCFFGKLISFLDLDQQKYRTLISFLNEEIQHYT